MNPLEALKEKLKYKPIVGDKKPIIVVVNEQAKRLDKVVPEFVDETYREFPRQALLDKLEKSGITKVTIKPVLKASVLPIEETPEKVTTIPTKPKKIGKKKLKILGDIIDKEPAIDATIIELEPNQGVDLQPKPIRRIKKKGIAVLGPETMAEFGDINKRIPKKSPSVIVKTSSYYMNNREIFVNFINTLFEPYSKELQENAETISCDTIGQGDFSLLTHQKIVRDYINLYTPYRGLLLYHGLGSGKTCTSIAIAEGMKNSKKIIILTPASLRTNYMEELKKCGDSLYKKNQYWEWISNQEAIKTISDILNLPLEYIRKKGGAWFVNITKAANYDGMTSAEKKSLDDQLDEMIRNKYTFINYNGLRMSRLEELTNGFKDNLFDNSVVIIDEAHNLISRIVNKVKKERPIKENNRGEKERAPVSLASKLYEYLLSAQNAKIVLLSGTPVINYPNEFGILFNILRGYIKTWKIPLNVQTSEKVDKNYLLDNLMRENTLDYLDYSPTSKVLTITRNPFGFKNAVKPKTGYDGVSNQLKTSSGEMVIDDNFISDDEFERRIVKTLDGLQIKIMPAGIKIENKKALPDNLEAFQRKYVDGNTLQLINTESLKRRIVGLSSYFRSAQESLLPRYSKKLGVDYHVVKIPMSDLQFNIYEIARKEERETEKKKPKQASGGEGDLYEEKSSTYRIFSRLFCNFVMPDRPYPVLEKSSEKDKEKEKEKEKKKKEGDKDEKDKDEKDKDERDKDEKDKDEKDKEGETEKISDFALILNEAKKAETNLDMNDIREGEIEGDEVLNKLGGVTYKEQIEMAIENIKEKASEFLSKEGLSIYSPKFLEILENIQDPDHSGLHLLYSQFRTIEGIGIFSLVLDENGFTRFKLKRNSVNSWEIDIDEADIGKPTYALYTGTESAEEKEIIRNIYNGDWNYIPTNIADKLKTMSRNNNMGEIIKVLMITSSGSEGINLRNTRYVHIMEPYWHPVRTEQVIGRARRICSHKGLPLELQTVEVFVYLMTFTDKQANSDDAKELRLRDLSKRGNPRVPVTSDEYLYEISEIKGNLTNQLMDAIKESSFDCYIYSPDGKCLNFANPSKDKFSYVPDVDNEQSDVSSMINKKTVKLQGKTVKYHGTEYAYTNVNAKLLNLYDLKSFEAALVNPKIIPLQVGTMELMANGRHVVKLT